MTNVSWYGGATVRGQTWPINDQSASTQLFTVSDLKDNPSGYGSALERYFLGSSGKRSPQARVVYQLLKGCISLAAERVIVPLHTNMAAMGALWYLYIDRGSAVLCFLYPHHIDSGIWPYTLWYNAWYELQSEREPLCMSYHLILPSHPVFVCVRVEEGKKPIQPTSTKHDWIGAPPRK